MVDLALLAEVLWCTILFSRRGLHRTLLYAGGAVTAGYAASQLSGWLTKTFVPPSSATFQWITSQVATSVHSVVVLSAFIPPEAASWTGISHTQWIAYHIVRTLFFVAITCAVFVLFVIVAQLTDALWDRPITPNSRGEAAFSLTLASSCAVYVTVITAVLLANLAWLRGFEVFANAAASSLSVHWIGDIVARVL